MVDVDRPLPQEGPGGTLRERRASSRLALEPLAPPGSRIAVERARVAMRSTARGPMASSPGIASGETPTRAPTPAAWGSGKGDTAKTAVSPKSVDEPVASVPASAAKSGSAPAATTLVAGPTPSAAEAPPAESSKAAAPAAPHASKRTLVAAIVGAAVILAAVGWQLTKTREPAVATPGAAAASSAPTDPSPTANAEIEEGRTESFGPLPTVANSPTNPLSDEKISLGRMLFFEERLSKNHDVSCNTCHLLDKYGVDGKKVSTGHAQQQGTRNSPSVYNSAGFFALMWDGKFPNVEEQAKGPLLNPLEMSTTPKKVEQTLLSMPEYVQAFAKAFPGEKAPVTFDNAARAIGAFERKLFTPSRWEKYLEGEKSALTSAEKVGFNTFVETGCPSCHFGPYVGATMFQKLGLIKAWPTTRDRGRFELTQKNEDYMVFRVPSLRNVAMTGPYLHDGSLTSLNEVVRMMARHQIGKELSDAQITSIVTWLGALTGELPRDYIQRPDLPPSTKTTPLAEAAP